MKGISPLIGGVLLLAFTIAVAGIASIFFSDFATERTLETEEKGEKAVDCIFSGISFSSSDVSHNISAETVNITVQNSGRENLWDIDIILTVDDVSYVYAATENTKRTEASPWQSGDTIVLEVNITDSFDSEDSLDSVTIISSVCPINAKKEVSL